ncbi:MAG TPA: hypothetical protein PLF40_21850, partial [Kofleriaceae bacterium]|nr:hypothetical protein [Kofleriaceae bacterium]
AHLDHAQQQQRLSDAQHAPHAQHSPSTNTADRYARPQYKPSIAQANYSTAPVAALHGPDATPQAPVTLPPNLVNLSINPIIIANRLKVFIPPAQFAEIQAAAADRPRVQALLRVVFEQLTAQVNASANGAAKAALNAAAADPATAVDNYYHAATLLKFQRPGAAAPAPRLVAAIAPATFAGSSSVAKAPVQAETIIGSDSAAQSDMPAPAPRATNPTTSASAPAIAAINVINSQLAGDIKVDAAKLTVVYRASWVATNPTEHILQGLLALRSAGAISWAKEESLRRVAALTSLPEASSKKNQIVLQITAAVFAVIGLPPGKDAVVGRRGNGLGVSIAMASELPVAMKVALPESERSKVSEALWAFTQLPIATEPEVLHGYVGGAGVYVELSETECAAIFGAEAWRGYVKKNKQQAPKPKSPAEAAQAEYTKGELPARLTQHGGEVVSGDNVPFEVVIDWDLVRMGLFLPAQRAAFESRKSAYDVAWHQQRVDGKSTKAFAGATRGANQDALTNRIKLALKPGEVTADFKVTAKVGSNHFLPAEVETLVTVKTQAARLDDGRAEIMGPGASPFALAAMTAKENDFDLGWAKDKIARRGDDHGTRYDGDMDPRHVMQSLEERKATREMRIAELEAARDYLRQRVQASDVKEAIASFDEQIRKLREEGKHIESDVAAGWQMFDVRGTYVSRTEGVASGPLDLYGEVQRYAASPSGPLVGVRIRDLSRRFEQESYVFNAIAPTFDAALESAFVDFCKTYPTGTVAVFAQAMGPATPVAATVGAAAAKMQPTGKMVGFELATTSRWKDIKSAVVEPAVQVLMGAATSMAMIFAPYAAAPLMVAQMVVGSATTIDDLFEKSSRGTLHTKGLAVGLGQLAMNLLPMLAHARMASAGLRAEAALARAEAGEAAAIAGGNEATISKAGTAVDKALRGVVKPSQFIRYATFAGMVGGNVLIMREETVQLLAQLKAQDVAAIAEMHLELVRLSATTHPSDPRLAELTRAIEARAAGVRGRFSEAFNTVVGGQLAMLIPQGMWDMFESVSPAAKAAGRGDHEYDGRSSGAGHADG